jgi:hypothetical protein
MLSTILVVVLILLLIGALPRWGYNSGWGYGPGGIVGRGAGAGVDRENMIPGMCAVDNL